MKSLKFNFYHLFKQALEDNLNYNENKLKSSSASKYQVKFDDSQETNASLSLIPEYENYTADELREFNEGNSNESSFNEINSSLESNQSEESDDEIEVIVTEKGSEPIKKRRPLRYRPPSKKKTINTSLDELVELDATSLAYIQTPNSKELPDLPYIDYDPGTKTFILPIRSRVVTLYSVFINDSNGKKLLYSEHLCSGTIGELPCLRNSNRYLIIFDNGFVSYVKPNDVFPIFDLFESPFARLDLDHAFFVQKYFQHYPNRLMVHLDVNDIVGTCINSKWHQLKVIEVDASLVRLELDTEMFDLDSATLKNHSVWYYRGTFNFLPLYETIQNRINESDQLDEYEKYIKDRKSLNEPKLTSLFSSTSYPRLVPASCRNKLKERIIQGQSKLLELSNIIRNEIVKFLPHACTNVCVVKWETNLERVQYVNPLLMPAMHGWQRHICQQTQTLNTASKKWVKYMAPCGRMLRSTGEVDHYLLLTNSKLTIDMFSFDCFILTDREFEANARNLKIADITQGRESVPISCVNCVDSSEPEQFEYSNKRIALEDVPLDTNNQLMEGCMCEDNCRDRSKCSCWHKTFEATTFDIKNGMNTNVGYRGRRLQDFVSTGIFECNPLCKCDHRCSNRVVQNGISLRLQLYKTPNKGWAIRCLDDIPKGQFICTYSGHLMTEEQSDVRALETGDVYFAELDFVECLSRLKAGYVYKSDDDSLADSDSSNSPIRLELNSTFNNNKHNRALRKKTNNLNKTYDDEVICLDSDEDEQDRTERIANLNIEKCQQAKDLEDKMVQMREEKKRNVESSIITNGFFTNQDNRFFYQGYLNDPRIFIMDAKLCGNIGRFFNHSCSPNVFVQNVFVDTYDLRFPWLAFFTLNSIRAGTELSWDYQYTVGSVPGVVPPTAESVLYK